MTNLCLSTSCERVAAPERADHLGRHGIDPYGRSSTARHDGAARHDDGRRNVEQTIGSLCGVVDGGQPGSLVLGEDDRGPANASTTSSRSAAPASISADDGSIDHGTERSPASAVSRLNMSGPPG